jgi:hypothetical protein
VKHISTARLGSEQWEALVESTCLASFILDMMLNAQTSHGGRLFDEAVLAKARQRVIEGPPDLIEFECVWSALTSCSPDT